MKMLTPRAGTAGMTLIEVMVAMLITTLVVSAGFALVRQQGDALGRGNDQMRVLQNARFSLDQLEKDLRTVGLNRAARQPALVYADSNTVVFNADYVAREAYDPKTTTDFAVYIDPNVPEGSYSALAPSAAVTLPNGKAYPGELYLNGAEPGSAETILFYFAPDASTARTDDYVLFRQVNNLPPDIVARDLVRLKRNGKTLPFFEFYYDKASPSGGPSTLEAFPSGQVLYHSEAHHGGPSDTASVALVDEVRAVLVNVSGSNGRTDAREQVTDLSRLVRLPNAQAKLLQTCGGIPLVAPSFSGSSLKLGGGAPFVRLTWAASPDENGGERDVLRYVLYRRKSTVPDWTDPLVSLPPSGGPYSYDDTAVEPNTTYVYGVAVQDCTPSFSATALITVKVDP